MTVTSLPPVIRIDEERCANRHSDDIQDLERIQTSGISSSWARP